MWWASTTARAVWAAASTALSACLYLFDFGTTIMALRAYYYYNYRCPHAALACPLMNDPICQAIRSGHDLHSFAAIFWACLFLLIMAHLTYTFVFWASLDPRHHPLRLAYFMPLIHLYRLLKLLRHPLLCKRLKELQKSQWESVSLYNALGAAVESAPQFIVQFFIAVNLGEYVKGSPDPNLQAQRIPTNLILSLVASMVSSSFSASIAVSSLIEEHLPLATRACVGIVVGCQTLAAMLAMAVGDAALARFSKPGFSLALLIYKMIGFSLSWLFIGFLLQGHYCDWKPKNRCLRVAHSIGLAIMMRVIGPIYVILKLGKSSCLLICGTVLHILIELLGILLVFIYPYYITNQVTPCYSLQITSVEDEENKYLNCKVYLGTILPSLFSIVLTTMLYVWIDIKSENRLRVMPRTSTCLACVTSNNKATSYNISSLPSIVIHSTKDFKDKNLHQTCKVIRFKLLLVVITTLFIQKLQNAIK